MNRTQAIVFFLLYALFIWVRDLTWILLDSDTLPILVGFPLFYWLGKPFQFKTPPTPPYVPFGNLTIISALCFFLLGIIFNISLLLVISWLILFTRYGLTNFSHPPASKFLKLLVILLFSFPWVLTDANGLGWWFRLTGAHVTSILFKFLGFSVQQQGTFLLIDQQPISVEAACAGLNTIQSMMIAGSALAYIYFENSFKYWLNIPFLLALSWVANTFRIILISAVALAFNAEIAMGLFHTVGGLAVILFMFFCAWGFFELQKKFEKQEGR